MWYELLGDHYARLERQFPSTIIKEVFKTGPEEVHDHDIVVTLNAEPHDSRHAYAMHYSATFPSQVSHDLGLVDKLRVLRADWLLYDHSYRNSY